METTLLPPLPPSLTEMTNSFCIVDTLECLFVLPGMPFVEFLVLLLLSSFNLGWLLLQICGKEEPESEASCLAACWFLFFSFLFFATELP